MTDRQQRFDLNSVH